MGPEGRKAKGKRGKGDNKVTIILALAIVFIVIGLLFLVNIRTSSEPEKVETTDFVSLVNNLRNSGANVEIDGDADQPFLGPLGSVIYVNGEEVQVYEYESKEEVQADAVEIPSDGSDFDTTIIVWHISPHFYKKEKIIVLYLGNDEHVRGLLETELGQQFAGM